MFWVFVKRNGRVILEYCRDGNVDAYYKFSQLFHDAEVGDTVYWQDDASGMIVAKIMVMEGMKVAAL